MGLTGTEPGAIVASERRRALERLKTLCFSDGVAVSDEMLAALGGADALTIHEYATTGGIAMSVSGVAINAPFDSPQSRWSPVALVRETDGFALRIEAETYPIDRILPLPGYLDVPLSSGRLARDIVMSHGDRIRLSPIKGCVYDCAFCDLGELRYERREFSELAEALDLAMLDSNLPPRHVLISGGSPGPAHVAWFNQLCADLIRYSPLPTDVMLSPQDIGAETVDILVDAGVNSLSINIELFDEAAAMQHLGKKRRMAWSFFEETARRAVELLPEPGRVRSLIIPGLEPEGTTIAGIDYLASLGVAPIISPFRPAVGTKLVGHPAADAALLGRVLEAAREAANRHGVQLGPACEQCQHNTLTFPWDTIGLSEFHR